MLFQLLAAFSLATGAAAPANGTDNDPNENACAVTSGAERIAGCTAWMESRKLDDADAKAAFNIRGSTYLAEKDYARAVADFSDWIRLAPKDAMAYLSRADAYTLKGDYALAIADYGVVIRVDPSVLNAFNNRAWSYYRLKEYSRAVSDYDTVIQRDPRNVQALYIRGLAEGKLGHSEASKADIARAIALDPNIANRFAKATGPIN